MRWEDERGYIRARSLGPTGYVYEHVLVAEQALGKPLPPGAVVHHANETKGDNRNSNLVICQDTAYHSLLHQRLRALQGCGDPSKRRCVYCRVWDHPHRLMNHSKTTFCHRVCGVAQARKHYARTKVAA